MMTTTPLPRLILVLGRPGSGKGTLCQCISEEFGYVNLSAGEILRQEKSNQESPFKSTLDRCFADGSFIPAEVTVSLLEQAISAKFVNEEDKNKFIIDGFPVNRENVRVWDKQMGDKCVLQFVIHLQCDEKICIERCLSRGQSSCPRADDNVQRVTQRMKMYDEITQCVLDEYIKMGVVKTIDASQTKQQVFDAAKLMFQEHGEYGQK